MCEALPCWEYQYRIGGIGSAWIDERSTAWSSASSISPIKTLPVRKNNQVRITCNSCKKQAHDGSWNVGRTSCLLWLGTIPKESPRRPHRCYILFPLSRTGRHWISGRSLPSRPIERVVRAEYENFIGSIEWYIPRLHVHLGEWGGRGLYIRSKSTKFVMWVQRGNWKNSRST